jgi:hypothetical protein
VTASLGSNRLTILKQRLCLSLTGLRRSLGLRTGIQGFQWATEWDAALYRGGMSVGRVCYVQQRPVWFEEDFSWWRCVWGETDPSSVWQMQRRCGGGQLDKSTVRNSVMRKGWMNYTIPLHWLIQPASPTSTLHLPPSTRIRFSPNIPSPAKVLLNSDWPLMHTTDSTHTLSTPILDSIPLRCSFTLWLMTSGDGTHSNSRNVIGKFTFHTVQKP